MLDGLWVVQFESLHGRGTGIAVFKSGRVLGGDEAFTYIGNYAEDGRELKARVTVSNYRPEVRSLLGIEGDYDLDIIAPVHNETMMGIAHVVDQSNIKLAFKLTKKTDL